jgi:hypothetical protein
MRLLLYAVAAGLCLSFTARSEPVHKIPFRYQDGLIWLKVELAGKKEPLNFLLDSGASASAIDSQTAEACRIPFGDRKPVKGVIGPSFAYRVNDFQATVEGIPLSRSVLAVDLGSVSNRCHRHIDGIVGFDFFRNRIMRIDFNAGQVCLLKDCEPDIAKCDVLQMKACNGAFCVPVEIAGNPERWMRLDTGCDSALEWVAKGPERRQLNGPTIGLTDGSTHYINTSARIGKDRCNHITVGIHTKEIFPGEDGLLGNALLSKFCVTIDARRSRVIFENPR